MRALAGQPITLYGDGMQVRDVLFADDLVDAFLIAQAEMPKITGEAFNVGGGPANTISLLDLLDQIATPDRRPSPTSASAPGGRATSGTTCRTRPSCGR